MTASFLLTPAHPPLDTAAAVGYGLAGVRTVGSVGEESGAPVEVTAFGALVKQLRLSKGLTQREVAEAGHLATGYIGGVENGSRGQRPAKKFVLKFAKG